MEQTYTSDDTQANELGGATVDYGSATNEMRSLQLINIHAIARSGLNSALNDTRASRGARQRPIPLGARQANSRQQHQVASDALKTLAGATANGAIMHAFTHQRQIDARSPYGLTFCCLVSVGRLASSAQLVNPTPFLPSNTFQVFQLRTPARIRRKIIRTVPRCTVHRNRAR